MTSISASSPVSEIATSDVGPVSRALARCLRGLGWFTGVFWLFALWQVGHDLYGSLILPAPLEAFSALHDLLMRQEGIEAAGLTAVRAVGGFATASVAGAALGLLAGLSPALARAMHPVVTILLGVPPIAWIVLALLWFGTSGLTPVFTVAITVLPITFLGALQGAATLDHDLDEMAESFSASSWIKLTDLQLPHVASYLVPALATALGVAWKVTVMAELLGTATGIGAGLAVARVNLDTAGAFAWITLAVGLLLICDAFVLSPLTRRLERWRVNAKRDLFP